MAVAVAQTETNILMEAIKLLVKAAEERSDTGHGWCEVVFCIDGLKESVAATVRAQVALEYERKMAEKE